MPTFIQLCVHFYAVLGFPVYERVWWKGASKRERWTSFLQLSYNLLIGAMVIWSFYFGKAFLQEENSNGDLGKNSSQKDNIFIRFSSKPLLFMLLKINYNYNYPMSYPIAQVYLIFAGPRLVKQLLKAENLLLQAPSASSLDHMVITRTKRTFALVILTLNLLFLFGFYTILLQYGDFFWCCPAAAFVNAVSLYISLAASLLPVGVLLYSLLCTVILLQKVKKQVPTKQNPQLLAVKQISRLSRIVMSVYRLVSLPLVLFLLSNSLDTIVTICVLGFETIYSFSGILLYVLSLTAMLLYISLLGRRVRVLLKCISVEECNLSPRDSLLEKVHQEKEDITLKQHQRLQMNELEAIYGGRLQVRLFEVFHLSSPRTLVQMFLFLLNYSILIMQTK